MSVFDVLRKPVTVTRKTSGSYVNGVWSPGVDQSFDIKASVQPTSPNDMARLPEGQRSRQAFTLFTDHALRMADDNNGTNADTVTINNEKYEVGAVDKWANAVLPHHRVIVVRMSD